MTPTRPPEEANGDGHSPGGGLAGGGAAGPPEECRTDPAEEPSILARGERIAIYFVEECDPYAEFIEPDVIEMR